MDRGTKNKACIEEAAYVVHWRIGRKGYGQGVVHNSMIELHGRQKHGERMKQLASGPIIGKAKG